MGVNPKSGELGLVQYGGGFISLKDNDDGNGTSITLYALRKTTGGTPDKASCIAVDSTQGNASISILHEHGQSILLNKDGDVLIMNKTGDTWIRLTESDGVILSAPKIALAGGAMLGDKDPGNGDFVALAALVLTELGKIITWANSHTHPTAAPGVPSAPTAACGSASPVAATMVKAK